MRFPSYQGRFYSTQPCSRRGGQAEVYQAADDVGRLYAVKLALPGEDVGWLEEERALVEELLRRWPDLAEHIVPIVDAGEHEGRPFVVMPWVEDRLDAWLRERPLEDRLLALMRLAESVSRLQYGPEGARGEVVHRDVKPSNVFVQEHEGSLRVLLSDFGAAFLHLKVVGAAEAARLQDPRCPAGTLHDDGHAVLAPVASFQPNAWGLYDLSGNVREWAWDACEPAPAAEAAADPVGPVTGARRALRGSAFDDGALALHLANRGCDGPDQRNYYVGLRLARSL